MAHPLTGATGKITSWGESGDDCYQLINTAIRPVSFSINANGNPFESTPLDGDNTALEHIGGLFDGTFDFEALWPKTAPVLGNTGLLTLATTLNYFCKGWTLDIDFGEQDITPQGSATAMRYMPSGLIDWRGTFLCLQSSGAASSMPTAANGAGEAATFKMKETGAADAGFTGNVIIESCSTRVAPRDKTEWNYNFRGTGTLTAVEGSSGGPAIFPAGSVVASDWDNDDDGVPDREVILQIGTSRTVTAKAFVKSISVSCMVGEPIRIRGVGRFSDGVVLA